MAVFILGVGVISIAALFPVGIAHQQRSTDDIFGSIVAANALQIIRSKVTPDDFGTFEEFGIQPDFLPSTPTAEITIPGDWPWGRPMFFFGNTTITSTVLGTSVTIPAGSISIFNHPDADTTTTEVPWNSTKYGTIGPEDPIVITQRERYYPMGPPLPPPPEENPPKPQYVWDCMFRRFEGRMLVAIFVYRVGIPGEGRIEYISPANLPPNQMVPPLPISLQLDVDPQTGTSPPVYSSGGMWDSFGLTLQDGSGNPTPHDDSFVYGMAAGEPYVVSMPPHSWQEPGQWIVDQNNNIHRVLSRTRNDIGDPVEVELVRPVPALPTLLPDSGAFPNGDPGVYFYDFVTPLIGRENLVTNIWYIPRVIEADTDGDGTPDTEYSYTPVYATVREL